MLHKKSKFKLIYFIVAASLITIFWLLMLIFKLTNIASWFYEIRLVETYYMYGFVTLAALSYVLDTNLKDYNYLLSTYLFPYILFGFLTVSIIPLKPLWWILIVLLALVIIALLFKFVVVDIFYKKLVNKSLGPNFFTILYYVSSLTVAVIISFLLLHR